MLRNEDFRPPPREAPSGLPARILEDMPIEQSDIAAERPPSAPHDFSRRASWHASSAGECSDGPTRGPSLKVLGDIDTKTLAFDPKVFVRAVKNGDICSRYQIDSSEFASGGNGKVFHGKDKQFNDRKVVIKKVTCTDETKSIQFRREVAIMQRLDHPNICKLFETYEEGRYIYFVMELCEGGELFAQLADTGNLSEAVAQDMVSQIAGALNYAHGMAIAHRDLKPENVCLSNNDPADHHVKVIDWGLGKCFANGRMNSAVGSLAYAAPEVLEADRSSSYTAACDLWSLGVLAYVMLCGRPPFWGSIVQQITTMKKEQYPMVRDPWPRISDDGKGFIKSLLKANPAHRPSISVACGHRWLQGRRQTVSQEAVEGVLANMRKGTRHSKFMSVCVASAARQLDHNNFRHLHEVFRKLDANHDGSLDMSELANGFAEIYGPDSDQARNVKEMFQSLDLDGSGKIDYTEFCAAALGEKMLEQENVLWAAFKAFDVQGDDGKVTREEIKEVLSKANVRDAWTPEVCDGVARELMERFDQEDLGYLDFEAWLRMMRSSAWPENEAVSSAETGFPGIPCKQASSSSASARASQISSPSVKSKSKIVWVSLDPRTGRVVAYPQKVVEMVETSWQRKEKSIYLGDLFFKATIFFKDSETSFPFQRTPNGLRDVRRIEVQPGNDEVEVGVSGTEGEYRFDTSSTTKSTTCGVSSSAVDPDDVRRKLEEADSGFLGMTGQLSQTITETLNLQSMAGLRNLLFGSGGMQRRSTAL